jgi:glutamate--cysteine ligase
MGIMSVKDATEVKHLSSKRRIKISLIKEALEASGDIVQEGVHTFERIDCGCRADGLHD